MTWRAVSAWPCVKASNAAQALIAPAVADETAARVKLATAKAAARGRCLHSFTFQLNLSRG
jgi:hypothetical protein